MAANIETTEDIEEFGKKLGQERAKKLHKLQNPDDFSKRKGRLDTDTSGESIHASDLDPTHWKWSRFSRIHDSDHFMSLMQRVKDANSEPLFQGEVKLTKDPNNGYITTNYFTQQNCPHLDQHYLDYFNKVLADTCMKVYFETQDRNIFHDKEHSATFSAFDDRTYKILWDEFLHNVRTGPNSKEYVHDDAIRKLFNQKKRNKLLSKITDDQCDNILNVHKKYRQSIIHNIMQGASPHNTFAQRVAEHNTQLDPTGINMTETYGTRYSNFSSIFKYKNHNYYHVTNLLQRFNHSSGGQYEAYAYLDGKPTYYWKLDTEPFKVPFPYVQVHPENCANCTGGVLLYQDPDNLDNSCVLSFDRDPGTNRTTSIDIEGQLPNYDPKKEAALKIPFSLSSDLFSPQRMIEFRRNANNQIIANIQTKINGKVTDFSAEEIEDMFGNCRSFSAWKRRLANGDVAMRLNPNSELAKKYGISVANGKVTIKNSNDLERLHELYVNVKYLEEKGKVCINGKPEKIFIGSDLSRGYKPNEEQKEQSHPPIVTSNVPGNQATVIAGAAGNNVAVTSTLPKGQQSSKESKNKNNNNEIVIQENLTTPESLKTPPRSKLSERNKLGGAFQDIPPIGKIIPKETGRTGP